MEKTCKCAICGKEKTLVYGSIYLKSGACNDCYNQALIISDWGNKAFEFELDYNSGDGLNHCIYKDAFGKTVWDKAYKKRGNMFRCAQRQTAKIML